MKEGLSMMGIPSSVLDVTYSRWFIMISKSTASNKELISRRFGTENMYDILYIYVILYFMFVLVLNKFFIV